MGEQPATITPVSDRMNRFSGTRNTGTRSSPDRSGQDRCSLTGSSRNRFPGERRSGDPSSVTRSSEKNTWQSQAKRKQHVQNSGLPRYVHAYHSSNTEGTPKLLFVGGKKLSCSQAPGSGLMARKKALRCPHFASQKNGKWTELVCRLPAGGVCPDPQCPANPDREEPVPDASA